MDQVGARLGQVMGQVGAKLGQVVAKLGPVGAKLEPSWAKLEPSWAKLRPSWSYVGRFEQEVGNHNARLPHMSPKVIKDGAKEPNISLKTWILERFWASCWHPKSITK